MAIKREHTILGLMLTREMIGDVNTPWLRCAGEFAPQDFVLFGKVRNDARIGIVQTIPSEGMEALTRIYCISSTRGEAIRKVISSNMGYLAINTTVNLGYLPFDSEVPVVPKRLEDVEMIDFSHDTSFPDLLEAHVGRIADISEINPDISIEELDSIYTNLVYGSPRYP